MFGNDMYLYVIDSKDRERIEESRNAFRIVAEDFPRRLVVFILNKQDLERPMNEEEFKELFNPEEFRISNKIEYIILKTSATTGYGVQYLKDFICFREEYQKIKDGWSFESHIFFPPHLRERVEIFMLLIKRMMIKIPKFVLSGIIAQFVQEY